MPFFGLLILFETSLFLNNPLSSQAAGDKNSSAIFFITS